MAKNIFIKLEVEKGKFIYINKIKVSMVQFVYVEEIFMEDAEPMEFRGDKVKIWFDDSKHSEDFSVFDLTEHNKAELERFGIVYE